MSFAKFFATFGLLGLLSGSAPVENPLLADQVDGFMLTE